MKSTIINVRVIQFLKVALAATLFIISIYSNAFNENLKTKFSISKLQDSISHTEKVYIHFDKPYYSSGEFMWFKTYLVSANTNKPNAVSKIVHVEFIDPSNKIIDSRNIKIDNGGGDGEFYLPLRLSSGEYTIRAYTNFMRNFDAAYFFTKKINIRNQQSAANNEPQFINTSFENNTENNVELKPDVQFFPEGGYMVTNKTSSIGFKALGTNGKSIPISGVILDQNDNVILNFKTQKFGLGTFEFTPKKGEVYKVKINFKGNNYIYNLPKPLEKGVVMEVKELKDKYQVLIQSSLPKGVHRLTLTGLQNGKIVIVRQLIGGYKTGIINIPKKYLKHGIVQFTISDKKQKSLCERLVFIETDEPKSNISITSNKIEYKKRELVELNFDLNNIKEANMSLAVTDVSVVEPNTYCLDIKSHLLLNSELKGEIEQPGYYFDTKNKDRKEILDLLMMTQGWRQFIWNQSDNDIINKDKKKYDHKTGIRISGTVKYKDDLDKTAATEVSLTYINKDEMVDDKMRSLKDGKFQFGDYQFNDSTSVIIQAKNYKIKKRKRKEDIKEVVMDYTIELDSFSPHHIKSKPLYVKNSIENINKVIESDYITRSRKARLNSVIPFEDEFEKLEEVTVKHKRIKKEIKEKFKNRNTIYGQPTYRADFDEIYSSGTTNVLVALQGKIPGLRISTDGFNIFSVSIRGASFNLKGENHSPLVLLNNIPVSLDVLSGILAEDVSFVDILSSTRSAIYGSRAMGGVISVHTKRGNELISKTKRSGIINFTHPGVYKAKKFYKPNYNVKKSEHKNFDYRTTVHWQPTIQLNKNKKEKVSFYTADTPTTYRIEVQGVSKDGLPLKSVSYLEVE